MMAALIDFLFFFFCAFFCVYITYMLMAKPTLKKSEEEEPPEAKLKRRLRMLSKQQDMLLESAGADKISTFAKSDFEGISETNDHAQNIVNRIWRIMKKAGITDITVSQFVIFCFIGGIAMCFIILYFDFLKALTGIPIGMCVGAYLVYNYLRSRADKKKMEFLQLFPDAIDMMIRGVKAGLNIGRIMKLVSIESKDPVAGEYRIISQKLDLGVEPEKVLQEAADRIDLEEFRFLVVALVLQMENGGMLGEILANLSSIVRKRLELGLKLKAMSAEARMSAIVLSALPFGFAGIMALLNPSHLKTFTDTGSGQTLLKILIVLFSVGTFFMLKATKIKV